MEQEEVPGSRQGRKPGCREGPVVLGLGGSWCREGRSWEVEGLGDRRLLRPCIFRAVISDSVCLCSCTCL